MSVKNNTALRFILALVGGISAGSALAQNTPPVGGCNGQPCQPVGNTSGVVNNGGAGGNGYGYGGTGFGGNGTAAANANGGDVTVNNGSRIPLQAPNMGFINATPSHRCQSGWSIMAVVPGGGLGLGNVRSKESCVGAEMINEFRLQGTDPITLQVDMARLRALGNEYPAIKEAFTTVSINVQSCGPDAPRLIQSNPLAFAGDSVDCNALRAAAAPLVPYQLHVQAQAPARRPSRPAAAPAAPADCPTGSRPVQACMWPSGHVFLPQGIRGVNAP